MSDKANPAKLASAAEFDARLKRSDEDRWLATRYAPQAGRERLVALYLFNQELQRTLHTKEPMLGKIRLQWWRETVEQLGGAGALRRHDLAEELARVLADRADLIALMNALVDGYDDVLDDHLRSGGHQPAADHEARHLAAEGAMMTLAGAALDRYATAEHFGILRALGEARLAATAGIEGADKRWEDALKSARRLPSDQWPAVLHLATDPAAGPFARRWRMLKAALTRRL